MTDEEHLDHCDWPMKACVCPRDLDVLPSVIFAVVRYDGNLRAPLNRESVDDHMDHGSNRIFRGEVTWVEIRHEEFEGRV